MAQSVVDAGQSGLHDDELLVEAAELVEARAHSPGRHLDGGGRRLPASYANFLIANRAVLVPVYSDPADAAACRTLQDLFPGRRVIPIDCSALIRQNGSLHCIAMQIPASKVNS